MSIGESTPHIGSYVIIEESVYRNEGVCRLLKRIKDPRMQRVALKAVEILKKVPLIGKRLRGDLVSCDIRIIRGE